MSKKQNFSLATILGGVIVILIALVVYQYVYGTAGLNAVSENELSERVIEAVGKDIGDQEGVSIENIEKQASLYKITLNVLGQEYESYATLDGEMLFPQKIDLIIPEPKEISKTEKPEVDLFVMAYCPFGNQAEELIAPVNELLGDKANIELHYIIYSNYGSGYPEYCLDEENKYCSMHGIQEVNQGIRELCVQKYEPDNFWNFVEKMNEESTSENADEKWEGVAQGIGIDVEKIKTCQTEEGISLLDQELVLTSESYPVQEPAQHKGQENQSISGSPTLVINGVIYDGARSTSSYQDAICQAFTNSPEECSEELLEEQVAPNGSCE